MVKIEFQYIVEDSAGILTTFLAPEVCTEEELTMFAASHFYFAKKGWERGWPNRFELFLEGTHLFTRDVFILCGASVDSKPIFEVV
jgi:hypothetical protein